MKKKIIAFVILVALMASLVTGCTFIKENKEREANEILATVSLDGITLTITKNEYLAYANYMLNQYSQYGYTPDLKTLMPEIMDYMINQKYLIIKGMVYLRNLPHRKDYMASNIEGISINTPEGVLTYAERYNAIKSVNDSFQDEIDRYIAEYEQEQKNLAISAAREQLNIYFNDGYSVSKIEIAEGSFKEEYLKDEKHDESKVQIIIHIKKGDDEKEITMPVTATMYDEEAKFSTSLSQEEQTNKVVSKKVVIVYEEPITVDGETDYLTHKSEAFEYRVVIPRGTPQEEETVDVRVGTIVDRYKAVNEISQENIAEYFNYNLSSTPAEKEAYRQFRQAKKNMRINFDVDGLAYYYRNQYESAVLEAVRHELSRAADISAITDEFLEKEYQILVNRQKEEYDLLPTDKAKVDKFVKSISDGSVNLEKVYYVPVEAIQNEGYNLNEFFAIGHILFKFNEEQSAFINNEKGGRQADELKELRWLVAQYTTTSRSNPDFDPDYEGSIEDFDGTGIFPKLAFDPDNLNESLFGGDSPIYDKISADLRAATTPEERLQIFKDYMVLYNDDGGAMRSHTGYLITPKGIPHSYDGDDFPGLAWKLFAENPEVGSAFVTEGGESILGYSFTSYGLHLMMISFIPFADGTVSANGTLDIDAHLDSKGTTHRELIGKSLVQNIRNEAYTNFTKENKANDEASVINQKKFNKLLKDIGIK